MSIQNQDLIQTIETFYTNKYLAEVTSSREMFYCEPSIKPFDYGQLSLYKISSIAFDKKSDILNKLSTVYSTVYNSKSSPILLLNSKDGKKLDFYLGIKGENDIFEKSFKSHFGVKLSDPLKDEEIANIIQTYVSHENIDQISAFTGLPSLKNNDHSLFSQGLDSFIEAMRGQIFTSLFIADYIERDVIKRSRNFIDDVYTGLSQYETNRKTYGMSYSQQMSETETTGESDSESYKDLKNKIVAIAPAAVIAAGITTAGAGTVAGIAIMGVANALGSALASNKTESSNKSTSKTTGQTTGENFTEDIAYTDKRIKNLLEKLDKQSKRFTDAEWAGMFHFGCYFLSANEETVKLAASAYKALVQGNDSHVDESYLFHWGRGTNITSEDVKKSLAKFQHPMFKQGNSPEVATATFVHSNEMALLFGLPRKSVSGIVVKQSVEFGRNVPEINKEDQSILFGSLIHLGEDQGSNVELGKKSLAMHTLITGSTGSGKSTTTYQLIDEIRKKFVKFLVIEPTKGEYKHIYGNNDDDIHVYGTNCQYTPLLKINPFYFPDTVHVLEHVDRLVEIFNACWPMYAAMPVILKDAILKSYEYAGWDLDSSENSKNDSFPSFTDVVDCLEELLESSLYSDNTKADYKGALITRVKSLTQGLIKNIFTEDCISDKELFDENVIVDLSRIGSSETKSLIMGILMLKLSEYRMSEKSNMDADLKHVTILEEAHHILPRVSRQTSQESGNIKGKAVEMLSNAIAEMRTYGEGFIIVDQSPNMLDISALRNTNTKIIMRLSEIEDRNDIGKSAALSDDQINEIPKLEQGVAIVYQNGWEEAILCKVHYEEKIKEIRRVFPKNHCTHISMDDQKKIFTNVIKIIALHGIYSLQDEIERIKLDIQSSIEIYKEWAGNNIIRKKSLELIFNKEENIRARSEMINKLLDGNQLWNKIKKVEQKQKSQFLGNLLQEKLAIESILVQNQIINLLKIAHSGNPEKIIMKLEVELERINSSLSRTL